MSTEPRTDLCSVCGHHLHLLRDAHRPRGVDEPCGWHDCPCPNFAASRPISTEPEGLREAVEDAISLLEAAPAHNWTAGEPDETIAALRAALEGASS